MKLLFFYGTRPELIKIGLLAKKCKKYFDVFTVCTHQHSSLFNGISTLFDKPTNFFRVPKNRNLSELTEILIYKSDKLINRIKPDLVIVQGDTCTSFSCCLSSFYNNIKIGHVEAGLRTYNNKSPYPEEFYRRAISSMSDIHWCPTKCAKENLIKEKVNGELIITGNTIVDSLRYFCKQNPTYEKEIVITLHRRENKNRFKNIIYQINELSNIYKDYKFIMLSHPNPIIFNELKNLSNNIRILPPLPYLDFIILLSRCQCVITDSGGVQEECVALKKKCIVCRDYSERMEGVDVGICKIVGADITSNFEWALEKFNGIYENPFGDGNSCDLIIKSIKNLRF